MLVLVLLMLLFLLQLLEGWQGGGGWSLVWRWQAGPGLPGGRCVGAGLPPLPFGVLIRAVTSLIASARATGKTKAMRKRSLLLRVVAWPRAGASVSGS